MWQYLNSPSIQSWIFYLPSIIYYSWPPKDLPSTNSMKKHSSLNPPSKHPLTPRNLINWIKPIKKGTFFQSRRMTIVNLNPLNKPTAPNLKLNQPPPRSFLTSSINRPPPMEAASSPMAPLDFLTTTPPASSITTIQQLACSTNPLPDSLAPPQPQVIKKNLEDSLATQVHLAEPFLISKMQECHQSSKAHSLVQQEGKGTKKTIQETVPNLKLLKILMRILQKVK